MDTKYNESKKFQQSIKTELSQTAKSATAKKFNNVPGYGEDDSPSKSSEYSVDFEATAGSQMRSFKMVESNNRVENKIKSVDNNKNNDDFDQPATTYLTSAKGIDNS
jgi:hypothetical protein